MARKKRILWLDDDFDQEPYRLNPWVNALDSYKDKLEAIKIGRLEDFARELRDASQAKEQETNYINAIFLDVMLRIPRPDATLEALGFRNKKWLALEAGAQILGVMQNPAWKNQRPAWLQPYAKRKTILFTSHTTIKNSWGKHLGADVREADWVQVVNKDEVSPDGSDSFSQVIQEILRS